MTAGEDASRAKVEVRAPLAIAAAIPVLMLWTLPWADRQLATLPGSTGVFLALLFAFDVVVAFLLVAQYRLGGGPRLLVLSCAFIWSASMAGLLALAVPGVLAAEPSFGSEPNSLWWVWTLRHLGPPIFIGLALAPWPRSLERGTAGGVARRRVAYATITTLVASAGLIALLIATAPGTLPVIVDSSRQLTPGTMALVSLVNAAAVVLGIAGVLRRGSHGGLESWAIVAAVAFLGDVTYTFLWQPRFSVADYGARALGLAAALTVLLFMLRDITRLHQRASRDARRLEEQNAELREATGLRDHLAAVVGHDMRTPLAGLQGYLEILQDPDLDPEFAKRMVDRSWLLARRVMLLSEDLLAAATMEHGDLIVIREKLNVMQQLTECATCFPDLDLRVDCPMGLTVYADSLRLQQVLTNLVSNAQKHGAEPVLLTAAGDDVHVTIRVSDAGHGVPADFQPHLFDRYTQGGDKVKGGSGLGLSVVKDLVRVHGGEVRYDSDTNTFVVTLPAGASHQGSANATTVTTDEAVRS